MRTVVIVFGGSGHGKDTLADMIADELGRDRTLRCAFADPLKSIAMQLFGMPREVAYGSQQDKLTWTKYGLSARRILQMVGTEGGRELYSVYLWVDGLAEVIKSQPYQIDFAVVSDGRFWSERELGERVPGVRVRMVLVWRPSAPDLGLAPTFWNRVRSRLTNLPGVCHLLNAIGIQTPKIMHQSESEVWSMRQRAMRGEKLFDDVVVNDGTLEDLREKARAIATAVKEA